MKIEVGKMYRDSEGIIWKVETKVENTDTKYPYVIIQANWPDTKKFVNSTAQFEGLSRWLISEYVKSLKKKGKIRACLCTRKGRDITWICSDSKCSEFKNTNCGLEVIGTTLIDVEITEGEGMKDEN